MAFEQVETDTVAGTMPDRPVVDPEARWQELLVRVDACRACPLGHSRQHAVFGTGNQMARWMLIGRRLAPKKTAVASRLSAGQACCSMRCWRLRGSIAGAMCISPTC